MVVMKDIYKSKGLMGFTHGWTSVACRDVPGVGKPAYHSSTYTKGIYFGWYYFLRHCLTKESSHVSLVYQFISGGVAGLLSWGLVYPCDVVKTRIQSNLEYRYGYSETWRYFLQPQNRYLLWRGLSPCLVRSVPVNGIVFLVYENLSKMTHQALE